jgi:hypothetical protein
MRQEEAPQPDRDLQDVHESSTQAQPAESDDEKVKYKTLADLINAYHAKELTEPLIIDHPDSEVFDCDGGDHDACETVFRADNCELLKQALDLLQIPNEHG